MLRSVTFAKDSISERFMSAIKNEDVDSVKDFIQNQKADVNTCNMVGSALYLAVTKGNQEITQLLIAWNSEVAVSDFDEKTPIQVAFETDMNPSPIETHLYLPLFHALQFE